jgi:hypothetical protein
MLSLWRKLGNPLLAEADRKKHMVAVRCWLSYVRPSWILAIVNMGA